jgi:hypothetical protein
LENRLNFVYAKAVNFAQKQRTAFCSKNSTVRPLERKARGTSKLNLLRKKKKEISKLNLSQVIRPKLYR